MEELRLSEELYLAQVPTHKWQHFDYSANKQVKVAHSDFFFILKSKRPIKCCAFFFLLIHRWYTIQQIVFHSGGNISTCSRPWDSPEIALRYNLLQFCEVYLSCLNSICLTKAFEVLLLPDHKIQPAQCHQFSGPVYVGWNVSTKQQEGWHSLRQDYKIVPFGLLGKSTLLLVALLHCYGEKNQALTDQQLHISYQRLFICLNTDTMSDTAAGNWMKDYGLLSSL